MVYFYRTFFAYEVENVDYESDFACTPFWSLSTVDALELDCPCTKEEVVFTLKGMLPTKSLGLMYFMHYFIKIIGALRGRRSPT